MAEAIIKAGAKIVTLTADEVRSILDEYYGGVRAFRFSKTIQANATGDIPSARVFGPKPGFVWAMKRIAMIPEITGGAPTGQIFLNSTEDADIVTTSVGLPYIWTWNDMQFVVNPGENIYISSTGQNNNSYVVVTGAALEVPYDQIAKLL